MAAGLLMLNLKGTNVGRKVQFVSKLLRSKWVVIMAAIWIQCCSGSSYNFGLYSGAVKTGLTYDQAALNTLATFKDLGANVGIISGCVFDSFSPAGVLAIGAVQSWFGYSMLWLSLSGWMASTQLWQTCLYIFLAANGQTFFNTACVVTCVHHFPRNRGIVIGLLKGFLGLSGALLTQLFHALYPEDHEGSSFLILVSWLPSLMALLLIPILRPASPLKPNQQPAPSQQRRESTNLYLLSGMALVLAAYLMVAIVVENSISLSHAAFLWVCMVGGVVLFLLPIGVALSSELEKEPESSLPDTKSSPSDSLNESLLQVGIDNQEGENEFEDSEDKDQKLILGSEGESHVSSCSVSPNEVDAEDGKLADKSKNKASTSYTKLPNLPVADHVPQLQQRQIARRGWPRRGEDHTVFQALCTADFWLMFIGLACGMGSGLTAIDNMGQIGKSLGYTPASVGTFISLLSIWNFLGRLGFGALSEFGLHRYKLGRPVWLIFTQAAMFLAHLLISSAIPGSLYIGSIVIGLCYGAQWSVTPAMISEIFGLARFATLFNTVTVASPIGVYFFSVQLAGRLYDVEARSELHTLRHFIHPFSVGRWFGSSDEELECHGAHCFRLTFIILAAFSLLGCIFYMILLRRTSLFYSREIYARISSLDTVQIQKIHEASTMHKESKSSFKGKESAPNFEGPPVPT